MYKTPHEKAIRNLDRLHNIIYHICAKMSNLESHNAELIKEGKSKEERFEILSKIAKYQLEILNNAEKVKLLEDNKNNENV